MTNRVGSLIWVRYVTLPVVELVPSRGSMLVRIQPDPFFARVAQWYPGRAATSGCGRVVQIPPLASRTYSSGALKAGRALQLNLQRSRGSNPARSILVPISQPSSPRRITDERTYLVRDQMEPSRVYSSMVERLV